MDFTDLEKLETHLAEDEHVMEYEINEYFPPKLPLGLQHLIDCRIQLLLKQKTTILPGEMKTVQTTCTVAPHSGWILSIKSNPNLDLCTKEMFVHPCNEPVAIKLTNTTSYPKLLPKGICIGYLLLN